MIYGPRQGWRGHTGFFTEVYTVYKGSTPPVLTGDQRLVTIDLKTGPIGPSLLDTEVVSLRRLLPSFRGLDVCSLGSLSLLPAVRLVLPRMDRGRSAPVRL